MHVFDTIGLEMMRVANQVLVFEGDSLDAATDKLLGVVRLPLTNLFIGAEVCRIDRRRATFYVF